MAHKVAITKVQDGPRYASFLIYLESDGASADLADRVLIDPAVDFYPALPATPVMAIDKIHYSLVGFNARLEFDYLLEDTVGWVLAGNQESVACFEGFGGVLDRSAALDGTGKLMLTTVGMGDAGDMGTILIRVRKTQ